MKHFKLVGPETTRDFDIEDDEMLEIKVLKKVDYLNPLIMKNVKICKTRSSKSSKKLNGKGSRI